MNVGAGCDGAKVRHGLGYVKAVNWWLVLGAFIFGAAFELPSSWWIVLGSFIVGVAFGFGVVFEFHVNGIFD